MIVLVMCSLRLQMLRLALTIPVPVFSTLLAAASFVTAASASQPPGYADPKLCASCHPAIAKTYRQNGMGRSFTTPDKAARLEDLTTNNSYYHQPSDTRYQMLLRDGKLVQRRSQPGFEGIETNIEEKQVDYVVGSGNHMRTYVHRNADGTLAELPLAWYSEKGGYWAMNPGYDSPDYPYSRRPIGYDCMFCHNAYPVTPPNHDRLGDRPVYSGELPEGIDCQRCHGPGQKHVDLAARPGSQASAVRAAIVNPARLNSDRQLEVCAQCHLKTTEFRLPHALRRYQRGDFSYKPGEPLADFVLAFGPAVKDNRFETASAVTRMRESLCFLKSNNRLTCTTCHNPHDITHGQEAQVHYDNACRQCHTAATEHFSRANCTQCHMPKRRTEDIVHMVMTDHLIQRTVPPGDLLADIPERHEDDATAYHGGVVPYYPDPLPKTAENQFYLALAQVRDRANLKSGVVQLQKALLAFHPNRPEPYLELAEALKSAGQLKASIAAFQDALRRDPAYLPAILELSATLKDAGDPAQAAAVAKRATTAAPSDPRSWNQFGQLSLDLNNLPAAIENLRHALKLDPEMPEAHNGTGVALAQRGDFPAAETEFRETIRIMPNFGEAHGNLANVLSWKQDFRQAGYEFDRAVRLQPHDSTVRLNYGAMLNSLGRYEEAQLHLEAAIEANPRMAEARDLLGTLLERKGLTDDARRQYEEAVRLRPDLLKAQLDLGAVLAERGENVRAAQHLRLAAESSDPSLRAMAEQVLAKISSAR